MTARKISRRSLLEASALVGAGAIAGCAVPAQGDKTEEVLFTPPLSTIPVASTNRRFSVRRIYCVGRNYAAHAREMGSDPTREPPFFFQKPRDAIQLVPEGV